MAEKFVLESICERHKGVLSCGTHKDILVANNCRSHGHLCYDYLHDSFVWKEEWTVFEEENDRIMGFHLLLTLNQLFSYITWCGCFQGITIDKSVTLYGTAILIFIFKQKKGIAKYTFM